MWFEVCVLIYQSRESTYVATFKPPRKNDILNDHFYVEDCSEVNLSLNHIVE
jgi:hypothetical protein